MKNRSFILLSLLSANDRLGEPAVYRTTLVKQAFLAETIRPLYHLWLRTFNFFRYNYGPYADDIFHRLDTLIFGGLVNVTKMDRRKGQTEARYQITSAGHKILAKFEPSEIINLSMDLVWALQSVGINQASKICKLVYQEPEFAKIFNQYSAKAKVAIPQITDPDNDTLIALASLIEMQFPPSDNRSSTQPLPMREIVRLFLLYLLTNIPGSSAAGDSPI